MAVISSSHRRRAGSGKEQQLPVNVPDRPSVRRRARASSVILTLGLMLCDVLTVNSSFVCVYLLHLDEISKQGLLLPSTAESIWTYIVLANLAFAFSFIASGLYAMRRGSSRIDEAYKVFMATSLSTILVTLIISTLLPYLGYEAVPWTPQVTAIGWGTAVVSTIALRMVHRVLVHRLRLNDVDTRRALIVGAQAPGQAVWNTIRRSPGLGYRVQGFLSDVHPVGTVIAGLPVLGRIQQIDRVVRATRADEVLLAVSQRSQQDLLDIVALVEDESISIKVYPDTFQLITNNEISIGDVSGLPLVSVKNAALENPWNQLLKRGLDIIVSGTILVLLSPLLMLLALLIKLDSRGPVFFLQERVGMDGRPFYMIKFRTMRTDAEAKGPGWTTANDPRVTRLGRFLRKYSLDELPQFINVLIGEMSVVGRAPNSPPG